MSSGGNGVSPASDPSVDETVVRIRSVLVGEFGVPEASSFYVSRAGIRSGKVAPLDDAIDFLAACDLNAFEMVPVLLHSVPFRVDGGVMVFEMVGAAGPELAEPVPSGRARWLSSFWRKVIGRLRLGGSGHG